MSACAWLDEGEELKVVDPYRADRPRSHDLFRLEFAGPGDVWSLKLHGRMADPETLPRASSYSPDQLTAVETFASHNMSRRRYRLCSVPDAEVMHLLHAGEGA